MIAAIGVDVGSRWLQVVALDAAGAVAARTRFAADGTELAALLSTCTPGRPVAIDGPAGPSAGAHVDDVTLAPKFRPARGCEVELGRQRGIWVPWVTGPGPLSGWMAVAAGVHALVQSSGHLPLETYPHGVFTTLHGRRPPTKKSLAGREARSAMLRGNGIDAVAWDHDELDAGAAALVAWRYHRGEAVAITCPLDGTSVWLPA